MPWLTADKHQEEVEAARDIVLRRLGRSSAPRAALAELLERKEVAPHVAEEVLDRLESAGVVDDDLGALGGHHLRGGESEAVPAGPAGDDEVAHDVVSSRGRLKPG